MNGMQPLPGGALGKRPLHFIFMLDASGSMTNGGKIQSLNTAIREAIPAIQDVADRNPGVQVLIRVIKFAKQAEWHIAEPVPVENFSWNDISAGGETAMGRALELVASEMTSEKMGTRAFLPVLVLVSDGLPTDDFNKGLRHLMAQPIANAAVRLAVAIGQDASDQTLAQFIGRDMFPVLRANNPEMLVECIRLVSQSAVRSSSSAGGSRDEMLRADLEANAPAAPLAGSVW